MNRQYTFAEMAKPFLEEWGWAIFPVSRNKVPLIKGGCHAASTMPDQIDEWGEKFPWANVGLACGGANGIAVLDVDFPAGVESLRQIFASGFEPFADTIEVATPSGGRHYYFIQPDVTLKNRAGHIAPGLDIRSAGGSIIAPPSMHKSGRRYEWVNSPSRFCLDGLVTPAPMPYWLKMKASAEKLPRPQSRQSTAPARPHTILDMEEAELRRARPGTRNYALNKAAFVFGQFAAMSCISEGEAASRMMAAALAIGLTAGEAEPAIQSGFAAGLSQPRQGR